MFSSSREVYGNSETIIHNEDNAQVRHCESPYTASKLAGEAFVHAYQQCYAMQIVILRFSNVYGMYDISDRVIPLFIKKCRAGEDMVIYGEDKLLDFTYIDDTIAGILQCIKKFKAIHGNVFNIAYGEGTPIIKIANLVKEALKSDSKIIIEDTRTGEVIKYIGDITRVKEKIGYAPKIAITEGIKKTIAWYSAYYSSRKA